MEICILHGHQLTADGLVSEEFKNRIHKVMRDIGKNDTLIITGGITRPGTVSEAYAGLQYIYSLNKNPLPTIILEEHSKTTGENILAVAKLISTCASRPSKVIVFHRRSVLPKTKVLYGKLWPNHPKLVFVACHDPSSMLRKFLERTLMVMLAYTDPQENSPVWLWYKNRNRNANT